MLSYHKDEHFTSVDTLHNDDLPVLSTLPIVHLQLIIPFYAISQVPTFACFCAPFPCCLFYFYNSSFQNFVFRTFILTEPNVFIYFHRKWKWPLGHQVLWHHTEPYNRKSSEGSREHLVCRLPHPPEHIRSHNSGPTDKTQSYHHVFLKPRQSVPSLPEISGISLHLKIKSKVNINSSITTQQSNEILKYFNFKKIWLHEWISRQSLLNSTVAPIGNNFILISR